MRGRVWRDPVTVNRTPRKAPKQVRSRETVDAIVEAASRIIARDGVNALTMREVARVAGVTSGTLYHYFASASALLAVWEERSLARGAERFGSVLASFQREPAPVERVVKHLVLLGIEIIEEHMSAYRGLRTSDFASRLPERLALYENIILAIAAVLEGSPNRHRFRPKNLSIAARVLMKSTIHMSSDLVLFPLPEPDRRAYIDDVAEMLVRYLIANHQLE